MVLPACGPRAAAASGGGDLRRLFGPAATGHCRVSTRGGDPATRGAGLRDYWRPVSRDDGTVECGAAFDLWRRVAFARHNAGGALGTPGVCPECFGKLR